MTALYSRRFLAVLTVLVFFTNLCVYVGIGEIAPISPWHIIAIFVAAAIPLLLSRETASILRLSPLAYWCYGFILVTGLWILFWLVPSAGAWQELRLRILTVLLLLAALSVFSTQDARLWARRALVASVLLAVGMNIYEAFHPGTFSLVFARSAGLYVVATSSGAALVAGMIFSIGVLPQRYRLVFVSVVGTGVFLTFSRAPIACWFITVLIIAKTGEIKLKRSVTTGCTVITIAVIAILSQWDHIRYELEDLGVLNRDVVARLEGFTTVQGLGDDESTVMRKEAALLAWELIADQPLIGHGVAASKEWDFEMGVHNQYLCMMVDHGLFGFFILPLLILASIWRAHGEARRLCFPFAVLILILGVFSDHVIEDHFLLVLFALLAAMSAASRREQAIPLWGAARSRDSRPATTRDAICAA